MLLPYRDKDEFTMPTQHFNYMTDYFNSMETLVIICWKGNEEAFNRQLFQKANRIKKVIIADPNPDLHRSCLYSEMYTLTPSYN